MMKHWYFVDIWECPPCGRTKTYRERRYTPRPTNWEDRHKWHQHYDHCQEGF